MLNPIDFVVMAIALIIPLAIGVFYAWRDARNLTREEYLMAGRSMSPIPVSMSLFATFASAISLMSFPSDVYLYGFMLAGMSFGIAVSFFLSSFLVVPLLYPLQLTSLFEYLDMRYQSQAVRKLATVIGMLQTIFYMIVAMLAPGLAIQATTDTPLWLSVVVVGSVCTVYTSIGGIKSVIWTDFFQMIIMFVGILLIEVFGIITIGSLEQVYEIAKAGGRASMAEIGFDPRIRHTWWGVVIGGMMMWMTNIFNQSSVQRIASTRSLASSQTSFILNGAIAILYGFMLCFVGIVIYAYFYTIKCGPVKAGLVSNPNQLIFYYIIDVFHDYPGVAGLYMATIFSGALSTLSSGINALATNTVEDILGDILLKGRSEKTITIITKIIVFVYGIAIIVLTYLFKSIEGPLSEIGMSIFGVFGSAPLGMILVGCCVPWANKYGAFSGAITGLVVNMWIAIGSRLYGARAPLLTPVTTEGCPVLHSNETGTSLVELESLISFNHSVYSNASVSITSDADKSTDYGFFLYDVSYIWYTVIGVCINTIVNLTVSKLTNNIICKSKPKPDPKLIFPILRPYWNMQDASQCPQLEPNEYRMESFSNKCTTE